MYANTNWNMKRARLIVAAMVAFSLGVWAYTQWGDSLMANNYKDFKARIWIYESESSSVERRISPTDWETEEIRTVEFVTVFQDCQAVSLAGDDYGIFKQQPTLDYPIVAELRSRYFTQEVAENKTILPNWSKTAMQSVSNQDGTARVTLTLRRAGPWEADPYVDVEPDY